jgi:DNA replication protein DnaC
MSASSSPNCDPSPDNEVSRKASLPATVSERYERKCLAITANTPFSQWGEVFVEPAMTLAAVDRLVHHSTILEMNVESYRRRAAQARKARSTT